MADYVQIPPDSSGKLIDAPGVLNESGVLVQRERVIVGDLAAAIYNLVNALQRPLSIDPTTGRSRVLIDAVTSTVTFPVSNVATWGGAAPRDVISFQLERQSWALNVGSRIT